LEAEGTISDSDVCVSRRILFDDFSPESDLIFFRPSMAGSPRFRGRLALFESIFLSTLTLMAASVETGLS